MIVWTDDMRLTIGIPMGTLGAVFGVLGSPTGILPARLGPKIASWNGLFEAGIGCFHFRINDLQRFCQPAYYRHAAPEGPNHAA